MMRYLLAGACFLFVQPAFAEDLDPSNFDKDGSGFIDTDEEARIYFLHKNYESYRKMDTNFNGKIEPKEVEAFEAMAAAKTETVRYLYRDAARSGQAVRAPKLPVSEKPKDGIERRAGIILRQSFDDVSIFADPFDASDAQGASFAWSRDRFEDTLKWSARGVVALPITWLRTEPVVDRPYLQAYTIAPYFQFERESASRKGIVNNDIQNLTFGLLSETAYANFLSTDHYFHFKGGALTDFSGNAKSWLGSASWMPISNQFHIGTPIRITPIDMAVTISPKLRAEYASKIEDAVEPIFAESNEALRVGPSINVALKPINPSFLLPDWVQGLRAAASFSWLRDVHTGARYTLNEYSLTYNLNKEGTLGLQASYRRGRLDDTGENIDLVKLGLSIKDPVPEFQLRRADN